MAIDDEDVTDNLFRLDFSRECVPTRIHFICARCRRRTSTRDLGRWIATELCHACLPRDDARPLISPFSAI